MAGNKKAKVSRATVWWVALMLIFLSGVVLATLESAELIAGLHAEILVALEETQAALEAGDMIAVERAALRFWRLAKLESGTYLSRSRGRELSRLATALTDAAAGWKASLPLPAEQRQVKTQLVNLRQMLITGDYSQADTVMVWLQRR